jgi:hypothetical protein
MQDTGVLGQAVREAVGATAMFCPGLLLRTLQVVPKLTVDACLTMCVLCAELVLMPGGGMLRCVVLCCAMQLTSPVQWETTLQGLLGKGLSKSYEVGPGKVIAGIMKRIDKKAEITNVIA